MTEAIIELIVRCVFALAIVIYAIQIVKEFKQWKK